MLEFSGLLRALGDTALSRGDGAGLLQTPTDVWCVVGFNATTALWSHVPRESPSRNVPERPRAVQAQQSLGPIDPHTGQLSHKQKLFTHLQ